MMNDDDDDDDDDDCLTTSCKYANLAQEIASNSKSIIRPFDILRF